MITLLEPDVALTDFALAIECAVVAAVLLRMGGSAALRRFFVVFFVAVGAASLLGGIAHGFFADKQTLAFRTIWTVTLAAIGAAAFASWLIGARLWMSHAAANRVTRFAGALLALNLLVVMFVSRAFVVAIVHYLPAAFFLLASFMVAYRRRPETFLMFGIAGMLLTFVAAGIQQGGLDLHPVYFNYNALYHLVQGLALALIFLAARGLLQGETDAGFTSTKRTA
jgi:hypothetical protein